MDTPTRKEEIDSLCGGAGERGLSCLSKARFPDDGVLLAALHNSIQFHLAAGGPGGAGRLGQRNKAAQIFVGEAWGAGRQPMFGSGKGQHKFRFLGQLIPRSLKYW